jgi:HEAT repeat protein
MLDTGYSSIAFFIVQFSQVLGARGLGWLRARSAVSGTTKLLLDEEQLYISYMTAADAPGRIGAEETLRALRPAVMSPPPSVVEAAARALNQVRVTQQDIQS